MRSLMNYVVDYIFQYYTNSLFYLEDQHHRHVIL